MDKRLLSVIVFAIAGAALLAIPGNLSAQTPNLSSKARSALPTQIGDCAVTRIAKISARLLVDSTNAPIPGSGSAVHYRNGGYQVSYSEEKEISRSRVGDRVRMCLVTIPEDCPRGDTRGLRYTTTNLRTGEQWTLPDSPHSCGGA